MLKSLAKSTKLLKYINHCSTVYVLQKNEKCTFQLLESGSDINDKPRHDTVNIRASKYHEQLGETRKN